ncbi:hypothetical protein F5884DRAFT_389599 [Xylogone sp. PMI_703]|nr:hypothetical protein F5884DRAFT_389599 [Xylogone sp. PMI_703]
MNNSIFCCVVSKPLGNTTWDGQKNLSRKDDKVVCPVFCHSDADVEGTVQYSTVKWQPLTRQHPTGWAGLRGQIRDRTAPDAHVFQHNQHAHLQQDSSDSLLARCTNSSVQPEFASQGSSCSLRGRGVKQPLQPLTGSTPSLPFSHLSRTPSPNEARACFCRKGLAKFSYWFSETVARCEPVWFSVCVMTLFASLSSDPDTVQYHELLAHWPRTTEFCSASLIHPV